jgi:hypothetical protein
MTGEKREEEEEKKIKECGVCLVCTYMFDHVAIVS